MYHIALRKNGRTVKKMGPYDSCEAATHDGHALLAAGTVPPGVQVHVIEGAMRKPASKARAAVRRASPSSMVRGQSGMRQRRNPKYAVGTRVRYQPVIGAAVEATVVAPFSVGYPTARMVPIAWMSKAGKRAQTWVSAAEIKPLTKANPRRRNPPGPGYRAGHTVAKGGKHGEILHAIGRDNMTACGAYDYAVTGAMGAKLADVTCAKCAKAVRAEAEKKLASPKRARRNPHGEGPYTHFVVQESSGRVVDGAWYAEDARDTVKEHKENGVTGLKVLSRATMKQRGYSVDNRHFKPPVR